MRGLICSADDWFENKPGGYKVNFDYANLSNAHGWCLRKYVDALMCKYFEEAIFMCGMPGSGKSTWAKAYIKNHEAIIVDNTNLELRSIYPYISLAEAYDTPWRIVKMDAKLGDCLSRQTHGVSTKKMEKMWIQFTQLTFPSWWDVTTVLHMDVPANS